MEDPINSLNYNVPKKLDIFQHLKLSLGNRQQNCNCRSDSEKYYCVPCKVSCCSDCSLENHLKHTIIKKQNFNLKEENINKMFLPAEDYLNKSPLFTNYQKVKSDLIQHVDTIVKLLEEDVQKFKEKKLAEIDALFEQFQSKAENTKEKIKDSRDSIMNYFEKNKNFFNVKDETESIEKGGNTLPNSERANTVFLMNFDILNLALQASKEIETTAKSLDKQIELFKEKEAEKNNNIVQDVEKILFPPEGGEGEEVTSLRSPKEEFLTLCGKLSNEPYNDSKERIVKFNSEVEKFKKTVYNSYKRFGNLKDIEKTVTNLESTKQKGVDNLFSKRNLKGNSKADLHSSSNVKGIESKDDVCLNNILLEKYFAFLTIGLYEEYFKMETKELQSSHADLMIKVNEEDEKDIGKVIEGSCDIQIFDKKLGKVIKKTVKLTKNPYGYTKFPIGCRYLLLGDKLYITGGKDETKEYPVVLIFDRKTESIKRIMDLKVPRSYHTMIYNDVFDTIMVIGGENQKSVEIFDPLTNRWQMLPDLLFPRANLYFFFDEARGLMYSMFGVEGKIVDGLYSDVIEYLDLTNVREGWLKLDANNKAGLNLRSFLNVYPLNNDMMLIYGGIAHRTTARIVCVLNLVKKTVERVDRTLMEQLRMQAQKNRRLSSIVSSISMSNLKE